ncbi:unnamed protein product, partial [Tilletia caries]
ASFKTVAMTFMVPPSQQAGYVPDPTTPTDANTGADEPDSIRPPDSPLFRGNSDSDE